MSFLNGLIPTATDSEGRTYPNAYLYSYEAGTNTPKDTYSDSALTIPNANPIQADGAGRFFDIYISGTYKMVLRDESGVVIWTQDNYSAAVDGSDITTLQASIALVAQEVSQNFAVYTDSGVADAYVLAVTGKPVAPTAYIAGMVIRFKPANTNTGASTVNVAGLGLKNLYDQSGVALSAGFLETGKYYDFVYESSNFRYLTRSGLVSAGGLATDAVETAKIKAKNVSLAKIADGTAYNLLSYDSGGVATTIKNPMRLITSGSIASAASLSFVLSTLDSSQSADNSYIIRLIGMQPETDDTYVRAEFSSDAGSTYASPGYYSALYQTDSAGNTTGTSVANGARANVIGETTANAGLSNAAGEIATVQIDLFNFNTGASVRPTMKINSQYWEAGGNYGQQIGSASNSAAADYDAIKLTFSSGNFAAVGKYYVYKMANAL